MPSKRSTIRWFARSLALLGALAVLPLCVLFVALHTAGGREAVRGLAIEAIRAELGLVASFDRVAVEVELLPPAVRVEALGIELDDPVYGEFAKADALRIRPSIRGLLQGRVDLRSIELERPRVRLVVRDGEVRNLPRTGGGGGSGPSELPFAILRILDARIDVDAEPHATGTLHGLDLLFKVPDGTTLEFETSEARGVIRHARGEEAITKLAAEGRVELGRGLYVTGLALHAETVGLDVDEAFVPLPVPDGWRGRASVRADLTRLETLPVAWDLPSLTGTIAIHADLADAPTGPRGTVAGHLEGVRIDGWGIGSIVDFRTSVDPSEITVEEAVAKVVDEGGEVHIRGRIGLDEGFPLELELDIRDLEFDRLMKELGVTANAIVSWSLDATNTLRGTLDPVAIRGPIRIASKNFLVSQDAWHVLPRTPVVAVQHADLTAEVVIRPDALRFERIAGKTAASNLLGLVHLGFDNRLEVKVDATKLDARDVGYVAGIPIAGEGRAAVQLGGTFSDPTLDAQFQLASFAFAGFPLGDVESEARLEKDANAVRFPSVKAEKGESRYRVDDLFLDFTEHLEATGTLVTERLRLAEVYHAFHQSEDERLTAYQADLRGSATIHYTLGFPNDTTTGTLRLGLDFDVPRADLDGFAFENGQLRGRFVWYDQDQGLEGGVLDLEHLVLHKGPATLAVSGTMQRGGKLQMVAVADRLDLKRIEGIGDRSEALAGVVGFTAEIRGKADAPEVDVDLGVTGVTLAGEPLGDARAYVRLTHALDPWIQKAKDWGNDPPSGETCPRARSGLADANWPLDGPVRTARGLEPRSPIREAIILCGGGFDGALRFDLAIGRTKTFPIRGLLELNRFDLAPLLASARGSDPLRGTLSGRLRFQHGALLAPETLVGRARIAELSVATAGVEVRNEGPLDVAFQKGTFTVERAKLVGPSSRLTIGGGGSIANGLALQLDGSLDLALLATLTSSVRQAGGAIKMRVNVSGPLEDPAIYGRADVENASFLFAGFPQPIGNMNGRVTFSAQKIVLEDFQAQVAGGRIRLAGSAALRGTSIERYDLDVTARGLSLYPEEGVQIGAGGKVALSYRKGQRLPLLTGTLNIDRVLYKRPVQLSPSLGELNRPKRTEVERYDPDADRIAFDIRVVDDGPIRVDNNLVTAEIRIDDSEQPFRFVGTDQRFGAVGRLGIPKGTLRFRNSDFAVRRGVIEFDDTNRIDPRFDVMATTEVRRRGNPTAPNWRIHLRAHGNRDSFRLDANSDPPLPEEDVMLLLAMGLTRAEAEQLQAGSLTGTAALEALAAVTGVDREVKRRVPLIDDFNIGTVYSPRTNRTEPQVSVGKRITDRVRLSASSGLSSESRDFRTALEMALGEQTSVQAVYDNLNTERTSTVGNVGVDLRWHLEFE